MHFGYFNQAWASLYDHLALTNELERKFRRHLEGDHSEITNTLSDATQTLRYATAGDVADFFRDRRNYIEAVATLDIIISVERTIRQDREERINGQKIQTSQIAQNLISTIGQGNQPPAVRRLLPHWRLAAGADQTRLDAIDQGMQYRNWLVHGAIGNAPFVSNPFLLQLPVEHILYLIQKEP